MYAKNPVRLPILAWLSFWIAGALVVSATHRLHADTIYRDSFDRGTSSSQVLLNGSAPDQETGLAGGSASAVWTASAWTTNGTQANLIPPGNSQAFLPFVPQAGNIYNLSAVLNTTSASGSAWLSLGFSNTDVTTGEQFHVSDTVYAWMLERGAPSASTQNQAFAGPASNAINDGTATSPVLLDITLNTTSPTWTASFSVNGVAVGTTVNLPTAAQPGGSKPIEFVGIGSGGFDAGGGAGSVSDFSLTNASLTNAVPLPNTAWMGLGLMGLLVAAKFIRRAHT
jgi:hypothetical protein